MRLSAEPCDLIPARSSYLNCCFANFRTLEHFVFPLINRPFDNFRSFPGFQSLSHLHAKMDAVTSNRNLSRERQNLQGAISDILTSLAVIVIPAVLLTAVLLGLITHNQVQQTYSALLGVPNPQATDSTALFVDFSATRLLTVASWISTVSSLLPSFAMTLLSYPVARSILDASRNRSRAKLPTPYQLSMLLGVLNGSVRSLWSWVEYRRWKRREPVDSATKYSIIGLVFVTMLG